MSRIIFVTGGARSGKSRFAEGVAADFGAKLGYLATAQALDDEMTDRIRRHQQRRGEAWTTIEEPLHLPQALASNDGIYSVILVDCLTLWLSNLLLKYEAAGDNAAERIGEDVHRLTTTLRDMQTPVVVVSSEVGQGIVPDNALARLYRDSAGQANQSVAAVATEAWLVVSGLPVKLK